MSTTGRWGFDDGVRPTAFQRSNIATGCGGSSCFDSRVASHRTIGPANRAEARSVTAECDKHDSLEPGAAPRRVGPVGRGNRPWANWSRGGSGPKRTVCIVLASCGLDFSCGFDAIRRLISKQPNLVFGARRRALGMDHVARASEMVHEVAKIPLWQESRIANGP